MVVTIMMRSLPPSPVSAPCPFPLFSRRLLIIGLARKIHYACERHRLGVRGWEEGGCNNRGEREASGDCLHLYHLGGLGRKVTLSNAHRHKKKQKKHYATFDGKLKTLWRYRITSVPEASTQSRICKKSFPNPPFHPRKGDLFWPKNENIPSRFSTSN